MFYLVFSIIISIGVSLATIESPLNRKTKRFGKLEKLIFFIKNNTPKNSIFFSRNNLLGFYVRCYGNRAVFGDYAFPFNEKYFKEYSVRYGMFINFKALNKVDFNNINKTYGVTHLIVNKDQIYKYKDFNILYENNYCAIIKLGE